MRWQQKISSDRSQNRHDRGGAGQPNTNEKN